jgi:RNA polymerase sigma-70 factor (ECF subfamily)
MAEEVLHNAYLRILEGKATFDGRSSFKTWMFGVIRNMALQNRSQLFRGLARIRQTLLPVSSGSSDTEDQLYRSEMRDRFGRLLGKLSSRQKEVLQLVFYHDMTIEEAARVMRVSLGSARTHYQRGKHRLGLELQKAGFSHD